MDADQIRNEALSEFSNIDAGMFFMAREIAAQLAEQNALLRSLIMTNNKGEEAKLRVKPLAY